MATTYKIDPAHSSAQFTIRHMMVTNVRGSFKKVQGTIVLDRENPAASSVEATIDATTLNTNDDQRDAHVRSADFLDVEKFPTITFRSSKVTAAGNGDWKVEGTLTIHGVSKPVTLEVETPTQESKDPYGNLRIGASATTKIKRSDFGLNFNAVLETGGVMLGDELKIQLDISAIRT